MSLGTLSATVLLKIVFAGEYRLAPNTLNGIGVQLF